MPAYPVLFPSPNPQGPSRKPGAGIVYDANGRPIANPGGITPGIRNPGEASQPGTYSDDQVMADWVARGGKRQQLIDNPKLMEGLRREGLKAHAPVTSNQSRSMAMQSAMQAAARVRAGAY
jgi:hypothetical protein